MGRLGLALAAAGGSACGEDYVCEDREVPLGWDEPSAFGISAIEVLDRFDGVTLGVAWPDGAFSRWALIVIPQDPADGAEPSPYELYPDDRWPKCGVDDRLLVPVDAALAGDGWRIEGPIVLEARGTDPHDLGFYQPRSVLPVAELPEAHEREVRAGCPRGDDRPLELDLSGVDLVRGRIAFRVDRAGCADGVVAQVRILQ